MNFVQLVTVDFISYTWMCVQTTVAIMAGFMTFCVLHIIDSSMKRANDLCQTVQDNYDYDCRMIINQWCRLYIEKYGYSPIGRDQHIRLFNLQDQLWTRTSTCLKTMQKIHHSM